MSHAAQAAESVPRSHQSPAPWPSAQPLVSVVIVHWNSPYLLGCLRSFLQPDMEGVEVVLVDNASTDGSMREVAAAYDGHVRTLLTPENYGYTRGANIGLRQAQGRYIILLNNDTEAAPGFIESLVAAAEADPRIGICCPKILSAKDHRLIDNVGHWVYPDGLSRCRGRFEEDYGQYDTPEDVLVPSGCAILVRREMLDDVGLLDEDFFSYCDDTDLGLRAQLRGWRCVTVPSAVVYHWGSAPSPLKAFLVERNRLWVAVKCLPLPLLLMAPFFTLFRFAFLIAAVVLHRGPAGRFVRGDATAWVPNGSVNGMKNVDWLSQAGTPFALAGIFARAIVAGLRGLPPMWRKRRSIQRRRQVSIWKMVQWWRKHGIGPRAAAWVD
ncbi:MAG: glycosyltransferase family 2 protein [Candidatus Binatia bacterium]